MIEMILSFQKIFRGRLQIAIVAAFLAAGLFVTFRGNAKDEESVQTSKNKAAATSQERARSSARPAVPVLDGIHLAAGYIIANTNANGRVNYERHLNPALLTDLTKYNVLRHAGTIYATYLYDKEFPGTEMHETRLKLSRYILENYVRPIDGGMYTIVSLPEEESNPEPQAKLGAAGLALIGMSNLLTEPDAKPEIIRGLGDFVLYLQKEDGSFHSKYIYSTKSVDDEFLSTYYPGEAALGLLYLYEADPQKKWLDGAKKALLYLADLRKDMKIVPEFDHWAMLGTEKLFRMSDNGLTEKEKERLIFHAKQMAEMVLPSQIHGTGTFADGSMGGNISPCSNGTKMEGLIAIYNVVEGDDAYQRKLLPAIDQIAQFLLNAQVTGKYLRGGLPGSAAWRLPGRKKKEYIIRIDNVQHVMSAWINYRKLDRK